MLVVLGCLWLLQWGRELAGGWSLFPWEWDEVSRVASPSGENVAILMQGNRGAMSGYRYAWHILPVGDRVYSREGWPMDAVVTSTGPAPKANWTSAGRIAFTVKPGILVYTYKPSVMHFSVLIDLVSEPAS